MSVTAIDIKKALARRHKEDMFFTEVKDGPTQTVSHHSKIDALAIKISWTQYGITGYEVKVSRSDFLRDDKWRAYLPMCNQLYFAVAPGVCDVMEIPESCGLVQYSEKTGLVRMVKKAPWRDIEHPVAMYQYLMFNYIGAQYKIEKGYPRAERLLDADRTEVFRRYLQDKADTHEIGRHVSRKLREHLRKLERQADDYKALQKMEDRADNEMREICKALDVRTFYGREQDCLKAIEHLKNSGGVSMSMVQEIQKLKALVDNLSKMVNT